jgi:hypothetical protein
MAPPLTTDSLESLRFDPSIHKIDRSNRRSAHWRAARPRSRATSP